jgi:AbrB family looped-hinge helix DNA binding protein
MALELTRLSERGQVVIPTGLRKSMNLKEGERFIVMGLGDTIILRKLELSQERLRLKRLIKESRERASKSGFSEQEVANLIRETRKASG